MQYCWDDYRMGYPRADWKDLVGSMESKGRLQRTEGGEVVGGGGGGGRQGTEI